MGTDHEVNYTDYSNNPYSVQNGANNPYAANNPYMVSQQQQQQPYYNTVSNPYAAQNTPANPYAAPPSNPYAAPPSNQYAAPPSNPYAAPYHSNTQSNPPKPPPPAYVHPSSKPYSTQSDYVVHLEDDDIDAPPSQPPSSSAGNNTATQYSGGLSDPVIRNGFLKKVYSILTVQLLFTGGVCACFSFIDALSQFALDNWWIIYVMLIPTIILAFTLACYAKRYPLNMYLLVAFTLSMSFTLGILCGLWTQNIGGWGVMGAFVCTAFIFVLITIFVMITKKDFSFLALFLIAGIILVGFAFFIYWIVSLATNSVNRWAVFGISLAGSLLMTGWVLYDTSQIVLKYTPDDYINATITLYTDFINLFQCLLCVIGGASG